MDSTSLIQCLIAHAREAHELWIPGRVTSVDASDVTPLAFYREFVARNVPCVIKGACRHWPAFAKWDLAYLRGAVGEQVVTVDATPAGLGDYIDRLTGQFVMPEERRMSVNAFLDGLQRMAADRSGGVQSDDILYVQHQNSNLTSEFATLLADVPPLDFAIELFGAQPDAINIWMGGEASVTTMHKDPYENCYFVLRGSKTFTLMAPHEVAFMHEEEVPSARFVSQVEPGSGRRVWHTQPVEPAQTHVWIAADPLAPDLRRHPLARFARPLNVTVEAGDMLYLPSFWLHRVAQTTDAEGKMIAVNAWFDMRYDARYTLYGLVESLARAALDVGDERHDAADDDDEAAQADATC